MKTSSVLVVLFALSALFAGPFDEIDISLGPMIGSLAPMDSVYEERFLTPGTSLGLALDIDAPGIVDFRVTGEYFWKDSSPIGWDGELKALIVSVMPTVEYQVVPRFRLFAGAGGTYITGEYSGTDDFGDYIEASGGSAGFILAGGMEVHLAGPLSGRLEYRHSFADFKTDQATIDGEEASIYPAAEADLGSSQFSISFPLHLLGAEGSIL